MSLSAANYYITKYSKSSKIAEFYSKKDMFHSVTKPNGTTHNHSNTHKPVHDLMTTC